MILTFHGADLQQIYGIMIGELDESDRIFWRAFAKVGFPFEIEAKDLRTRAKLGKLKICVFMTAYVESGYIGIVFCG